MKAFWLALITMLAAAAPVSAAPPAFDGMYMRSWGAGHRTLVLITKTSQGARVSVAVQGLPEGVDYNVVGTTSDGDCVTAPGVNNRTFSLALHSADVDTHGTWLVGEVTGTIWTTTEFLRIRRSGGANFVCGATHAFNAGETPADGAYSRFVNSFHDYLMLVDVPVGSVDEARITVALGDVNGDGAVDLRIGANSSSCGHAGSSLFGVTLNDVGSNVFASRTVHLTQAQLNSVRSLRLRALTGGTSADWFNNACRTGVLVALLIP